jgi:hypothetical protein
MELLHQANGQISLDVLLSAEGGLDSRLSKPRGELNRSAREVTVRTQRHYGVVRVESFDVFGYCDFAEMSTGSK